MGSDRGRSARWRSLWQRFVGQRLRQAHLPLARWLPDYDQSNLRVDLLAGAVVAALIIPQSLGYARIANVPVEVGLYAVPLALLAYAVIGSSPQLIVGPASTVAIVSGSLVLDITRDSPQDATAVTAALAISTGLVLVGVGLLRLAWLAEFLSKPIVTGFVFGLTLTIVIGQMPTLIGIPKPDGDLIGVFVRTMLDLHEIGWLDAAVGSAALALLLVGPRLSTVVPWSTAVLALGIVVSEVLDLSGRGVAVIGNVPTGLPPIRVPLIPLDAVGPVVVGGVSLALVALAEGLAATRLFATKGGYRIETEAELIGMGAANIGAGLSGGLAVAGSLSKTAAAERAGSRSQVTGISAAVIVLVAVAAFADVLVELPQAVLSAIVVAGVWSLMDVDALARYRKVRTADFGAALIGIAGVVLFGPLPGLGIAIVASLLVIIYRASFPRIEILGRIGDEKAAWGRMRNHPERRPVRGIIVTRLDAPLFWANVTSIADRLKAEIESTPGTRALVLDLEATTHLDTTSADALTQLAADLDEMGIRLYLARVFHRPMAVLHRSGFVQAVGSDHFFHSISQSVRAAKRELKAADKARAAADADEPDDGEPPPDDHEVEVVDDGSTP